MKLGIIEHQKGDIRLSQNYRCLFTKEHMRVFLQLYALTHWKTFVDANCSHCSMRRIFIPFNTSVASLFELEGVYPASQ